MPSRRRFLSAGLIGLTAKADRAITGGFVFESQNAGHRLRDRVPMKKPAETKRVPVVIVGGGIAGLSAAWRLDKRGFRDFVVLEMESEAGGNSRSGENEVSAYPWAAHYIPVPNKSSLYVRELMEEFGVFKDGKWDERHLCHTPQERLYIHGRWQEGIEPEVAASKGDHRQYREFERRIEEFRGSGEFTIPMELGAKPSALDRISFAQWLREKKLDSAYLNWYADYACRDDYGAAARDTSAWAGIHYFASREKEEKGPLTWSEGNGWVTKRLLAKLGGYVNAGAGVYRIEKAGQGWRVLTERTEWLARAVIFAAPSFLAPLLMDAAPKYPLPYSPWLTANLTLDRQPRSAGLESAWDNVIYGSPSLGYVVATHQSLRTHIDRTVWTYYYALAGNSPAEDRRRLLANDWAYWRDAILADLERAHPDIRQCVSRIDIFRIGHAMARPAPGFLTHPARLGLASPSGSLLFANSDLSGFSIFEEAQYRGVKAAERVLRLI